MARREPYKPISLDKKLGEIYFSEKCLLSGIEAAPKGSAFSISDAERVLKKYKNEKKPAKAKVTALADSLKLDKGSKLGKKMPYERIKYSDIEIHKVFTHSRKALVMGVQATGSPAQYLVLIFEQPLKATQLDDLCSYADEAPKNNLKHKLPEIELTRQSAIYQDPEPYDPVPLEPPTPVNGTNVSVSEPSVSIREQRLPKTNLTDDVPSVSVKEVKRLPRQRAESLSSRTMTIMSHQSNERTLPSATCNQSRLDSVTGTANARQPAAEVCSTCGSRREEMVDTTTSPIKGMMRRARSNSSSSSDSSSRTPRRFTSNNAAHSDSHSLRKSQNRKSRNGRSSSTSSTSSFHTMTMDADSHFVVEEERPIYDQYIRQQKGPKKPNGLASSPLNGETYVSRDTASVQRFKPVSVRKSSTSSSSSSDRKHKSKVQPRRDYKPSHRKGPSPINSDTVLLLDSPPSARAKNLHRSISSSSSLSSSSTSPRRNSRRKSKHEHGPKVEPIVMREAVLVQQSKPRSRSSLNPSSWSDSKRARKRNSKYEQRPKSFVSSERSCAGKPISRSSSSLDNSKSLFILATGRFKPFSELTHVHNTGEHGVCSICGEMGEGDPRQVEIISTDPDGAPVISDSGTVYMYSTTQPVEYNSRKSKRVKQSRRSSSSSSSSSNLRTMSGDPIYASASGRQVCTAPPQDCKHRKKSHSVRRKHSSSSSSSSSRYGNVMVAPPAPVYLQSDAVQPVHARPDSKRRSHYSLKSSHSSTNRRCSSSSNSISSVSMIPRRPVHQGAKHTSKHHHRGHSSCQGKKKIYRLESSDSDTSTSSLDEPDSQVGSIKVKPLRY